VGEDSAPLLPGETASYWSQSRQEKFTWLSLPNSSFFCRIGRVHHHLFNVQIFSSFAKNYFLPHFSKTDFLGGIGDASIGGEALAALADGFESFDGNAIMLVKIFLMIQFNQADKFYF
jgi:hypothetical protein